MHPRFGVSLPQETMSLLDRIERAEARSRLMAEAARFCVAHTVGVELGKRLKEGAMQRAERDRGMAEEGFFLEKKP